MQPQHVNLLELKIATAQRRNSFYITRKMMPICPPMCLKIQLCSLHNHGHVKTLRVKPTPASHLELKDSGSLCFVISVSR
jgi:hypothetical protein